MPFARVTVTIEGPPNSGKSIIAEIIQDALHTAGVDLVGSWIQTRPLATLWDAATLVYSDVEIKTQDSK